MAVKEHQFDISAKLDLQEMKNAVIQSQKEIDTRYDFKGISKEIDLNVGAKTLTLVTATGDKISPIDIITGPTTTLGSNLCKKLSPFNLIKKLKTTYKNPAATSPDIVAGIPQVATP